MIGIYEYTITMHGTIKIIAENFNEKQINDLLKKLGNIEELTIENVTKKKM